MEKYMENGLENQYIHAIFWIKQKNQTISDTRILFPFSMNQRFRSPITY